MISINIEKKLRAYQGVQVLRIKKEIATGSITRITGPSGAGKTTLLKMIAGLIYPDAGLIIIDNVTWFNSAEKVNLPTRERMPGFVFQDYALFPNMTVQQHLAFVTRDAEWIKRLLKIGQLESFADQKPEYLSGGQQQRLAILRALAIKPKLILMDEPFSALDVQMKVDLLAELQLLFSELKATVMIVSHNSQELDGICDDELVI